MIVADTGAIVALVDADDRHHGPLRRLFESEPDAWLLPWAVLPEVDYLLAEHVGARAQERFAGDLASGASRPRGRPLLDSALARPYGALVAPQLERAGVAAVHRATP